MILNILLFLPLISALLLWLMPPEKVVKPLAFGLSILFALLAIFIASNYFPSQGMQLVQNFSWIPKFGINYHIGLDGISMIMLLLTCGIFPFIILSSFNREIKNPNSFYALLMVMLTGMMGVFLALDGFLFYVAWEIALIPIYFIAGIWGTGNKIKITLKFFIYTIFGSLFMLTGILFLYLQTPGTHSFDINAFYALNLNHNTQSIIFWAFFIAFAIKMPIFPFHTWQPDTYTSAPTQGTMMLAGIMLKMGIYGVIRWLLPLSPQGLADWGYLALTLSLIGIIYASIIAIKQKDIKRLMAYASIAHVGLIAAGVFSLNVSGLQGAMIQMINHGINVVAIFFIVDIFIDRLKTRELSAMGGIASIAPKFSIFFLIVLLANVGLPLTNGFVGEFLLILGVFNYNPIFGAVAGLTIILGAVYMLRVYQKTMYGKPNSLTEKFEDLKWNEKLFFYGMLVLIFGIGIFPKTLLNISEPAVNELLILVKSKMSVIN